MRTAWISLCTIFLCGFFWFDHLWNIGKIRKEFLYVSGLRFTWYVYVCMNLVCDVRCARCAMRALCNFSIREWSLFLLAISSQFFRSSFIFRSEFVSLPFAIFYIEIVWRCRCRCQSCCACSEMWMHFCVFEFIGLKYKRSYDDLRESKSANVQLQPK